MEREVAAFYKTQRRRGESDKNFEKRSGRFAGFALASGNNGCTEGALKQAEGR